MSHKLLDWMPWFSTDFWGSVRVLRLSEPACNLYRWMLDYQWNHGSVPDDAVVVSRLYPWGASALDSWREVRPLFDVKDGALVNPKLAHVYSCSLEMVSQRSEAGKKSALSRLRKYGSAAPGRGVAPNAVRTPFEGRSNDRLNDTGTSDLIGSDLNGSDRSILAASPPCPDPAPPAKSSAQPKGDHPEVGRWFCARFLEATGKPYAYQRGKDGKAVKDLLEWAGAAGVPEIKARGETFFTSDFYNTRAGYSLTKFAGAWNELAVGAPVSQRDRELARYTDAEDVR